MYIIILLAINSSCAVATVHVAMHGARPSNYIMHANIIM